MYEYLLSTKLATFLVALGLSLVVATLCRRPALGIRVMLFNYGPSFAASFFIVGLFYEGVRSYRHTVLLLAIVVRYLD
jgi:multisubunit Na+/H+ antiporter MnhF subunit